jgi:ABC-type Fe3+-hydroxamate transport system substrate-binding protein
MICTDQMMREVRLIQPVSRIVSLVPSVTELLSDLGLDDRISGITKFCIHPAHIFKTKTRVGGTKQVKHDVIDNINPDLIIANKEENTREDIASLAVKYPVWISDIDCLDDALEMIATLGIITGTESKAKEINNKIQNAFADLQPLNKLSCVYLIWRNPFMAAGQHTFVNDLLQRCGFENIVADARYPELSPGQLRELQPRIVLLSSEPYPFSEKHIAEINSILPSGNVLLADGEYFSWYGSRLMHAPDYFNQLINSLQPVNENNA